MHREQFSPHKILPVLLRTWAALFILIALFASEDIITTLMRSIPDHKVQFSYPPIIFLFLAVSILTLDWQIKKKKKLQRVFYTNIALNSLLLPLSIALPVTLSELGLHPYCNFVHKDTSIYMRDGEVGWRLRPNARANHNAVIEITSKGLRSPERDYLKPDGSKRIVFLGDSITYGLRLEYADTFPNQTEIILKEKTGAAVECINAGIPGYSTWQEFVFFEKEAIRYQPDIVVLSFCLNDVLNTYTGVRFGDYGQDDPVPFIEENWMEFLLKRSAIVYMGKLGYSKLRYGKNLKEDAVYREGLSVASLYEKAKYPEIQQAWNLTHSYIKKMADLSTQKSSHFLLVVFPYSIPRVNNGIVPWTPESLLDFAKQSNIPAIDLLPVIQDDMKSNNLKIDHYFRDACHPTAYGSRLAAKAISSEILNRQWIK